MIRSFWRQALRYWQLTAAILGALAGLGLQLDNEKLASHIFLSVISIALIIPLLVDMWETLRSASIGVNILPSIGIITAVSLKQYWVAIVIALMAGIGIVIKQLAVSLSRKELTALEALAPSVAHVMRGRKLIDIAAAEIQSGDKISIAQGEIVPVDAIILEGNSNFDESALTGQELPDSKSVGDEIVSGSINLDADITVRALRSAEDSQYQQLITIVRTGGGQKTPFERLSERFCLPFTVISLIVASAAWIIGGHAIRFLDVIVVATPGPLLFAMPIALMASMYRATKSGIIFKTSTILERFANVQTIAFDTAGALTAGASSVAAVKAFAPFTQDEVLAMAASLQSSSTKASAQAVITAANEQHLKFGKAKHVSEQANGLLQAQLHGKEVLLGELQELSARQIRQPAGFKPGEKSRALYVAVGGKLAGAISFTDETRTEAASTFRQLRKLGITQLFMLTSSSQSTADRIAKQFDITDTQAEATTGEKLTAIEGLPERPVAFIGNGTDDAALLTTADIGIAINALGSPSANESANIIILSNDLTAVATARNIASGTLNTAKQSIAIGIGLSWILILVFATGKIPALAGAIIQEVIDVIVIFYVLRLRNIKLHS